MSDLTANDIELTIDPEFEGLLPAHSPEESAELKAAVEADGRFTDPILFWHGENVVLDGHQRMKLWQSLPEDTPIPPPQVRPIKLLDRNAAILWVFRHQLARRNLTPQQTKLFRGRVYKALKKPEGRPPKPRENKAQDEKRAQNAHVSEKGRTGEDVGKKFGVNQSTVRRDAAFADALDTIRKTNLKFAVDVEEGRLKVAAADVIAAAALPSKHRGKALVNIRSGRPVDHGLAERDNGKPKIERLIEEAATPVSQDLSRAPEFAAIAKKLQTLLNEIKSLSEERCGSLIKVSEAERDIGNAKRMVKFAAPYNVCPYCKGNKSDKCQACKSLGWVNQLVWKSAPEDMRLAVESAK